MSSMRPYTVKKTLLKANDSHTDLYKCKHNELLSAVVIDDELML